LNSPTGTTPEAFGLVTIQWHLAVVQDCYELVKVT
jgi:hypothetical protein